MSKRNYTQYSKQNEVVEEEVVVNQPEAVVEANEVKMEQIEAPVVETPVVEAAKAKTETGVVANCVRLNVRINPDTSAPITCVLPAGETVTINTKKSTKEWFSVRTAAGVNGYCMRKFISTER